MDKKKIFILVLLVAPILHAYGWGERGHMLVASVSYTQLSEEQRAIVMELLSFHPDYNDWIEEYKSWRDEVEEGRFLMMKASLWPDVIRDPNNPNHRFHRPEWHYVTYKLHFPNAHNTDLPSERNVVGTIDFVKSKVFNEDLEHEVRAMYLAWLIHLVGDIYQPLHNASLFNATYPEGDRGGNLFFVRVKGKGAKLHSVWDQSPGKGSNFALIKSQGEKLIATTPKPGAAFDPRAISLESFELAKTIVHQNGALRGSDRMENAPELTGEYVANMKQLAGKRCALAGYSLSQVLSKLPVHAIPFEHNDGDEDIAELEL
ncbi:S1/P1 nuclease [Chryseolinea soli]|uniref:S1/P1 Nuclease n=1 Tax=Chryseolinea soli TaxID=2321403 RepID=A0A385SQE0_9BACT|nr:S1/P1 nuclease [Chryseolinea soli]AYB32185.1 hypothetical protein D4L85_17110 [Chryseolinea soli]